MKKLLSILILTLSITAFAQNKAQALLDEVSQKVKSYENIALNFKYTLVNVSENIKQETKGDVVMQGDKYRLNILGITRLFDGKSLYSISTEDEEVSITSNIDEENNAITPSKMLSFYEDGYTYTLDIKQDIRKHCCI